MEEQNKEEKAEGGKEAGLPPLTVPRAIIWNAVIIAAAIVLGAFIVAHGPFQGAADRDQAAAETAKPDIRAVNLSEQPYIGSPTAPVVMAYWSDFQCPYCKQFEEGAFQEVVRNYVDTGKVAVVFKDFSFLGPDSATAALYARAVWQLYPEKYFAWRTALFAAQDAENGGFGDEASVKKMTSTVAGIDVANVASSVGISREFYQKQIDADRAEAVKFGIEGTPSFITGTTLIPGVSSYETFKEAFDKQLK